MKRRPKFNKLLRKFVSKEEQQDSGRSMKCKNCGLSFGKKFRRIRGSMATGDFKCPKCKAQYAIVMLPKEETA